MGNWKALIPGVYTPAVGGGPKEAPEAPNLKLAPPTTAPLREHPAVRPAPHQSSRTWPRAVLPPGCKAGHPRVTRFDKYRNDAQRDRVPCPPSRGWLAAELGFEPVAAEPKVGAPNPWVFRDQTGRGFITERRGGVRGPESLGCRALQWEAGSEHRHVCSSAAAPPGKTARGGAEQMRVWCVLLGDRPGWPCPEMTGEGSPHSPAHSSAQHPGVWGVAPPARNF